MTDNLGLQRRALIVDDDRAVLSMLDDTLTDAGFATTCVTGGQPALDALQYEHFDLLVVDVGLPDMNGMFITEHARSLYGYAIAIFVITGDNRKRRCITALELGADDFLAKPFDTNELLARIDARLARASISGT